MLPFACVSSRICDVHRSDYVHPQFFQIAVIDVMSAPVRHSIELDAMREFHCGGFVAELWLLLMAMAKAKAS